jgi:hypothetical protein
LLHDAVYHGDGDEAGLVFVGGCMTPDQVIDWCFAIFIVVLTSTAVLAIAGLAISLISLMYDCSKGRKE